MRVAGSRSTSSDCVVVLLVLRSLECSNSFVNIYEQGCTKSGCPVAREVKFCTQAPYVFSIVTAGFPLQHTKMCTISHVPSWKRQISVTFTGHHRRVGSPVWNFLQYALLQPGIRRWLLEFRKIKDHLREFYHNICRQCCILKCWNTFSPEFAAWFKRGIEHFTFTLYIRTEIL